MKEQIIELSQDQVYNDMVYHNCPFCGGKSRRILAITKKEDCVISHCFSTSCEANGVKRWYLDGFNPQQVKNTMLKKEKHNKERVYQLPDRYTQEIPSKFINYLGEYHITQKLISKYNIGYVDSHTYNNKVIFEDRLLIPTPSGFVVRSLEEQPKWKNFSKYFESVTETEYKDMVVLVEDPLSMIRVGEHMPCICLLGTSMSDEQFQRCREYDEVVIWLDGDTAGVTAMSKIKIQLNPYIRNRVVVTRLDPKCYSDYELKEKIK